MCGLAGVVSWEEKFRVTRETLSRMSSRIAHRGPDGEGVYLTAREEIRPDRPQVGLVHRRLAILDPDPRANQPFTDGHGRWIVFNGEIYNFRELRAELSRLKPDYAWRTQCDTEVLLLSYALWGEQCVEHLDGMFAFAIWDEAIGALACAIDRMGQKPLYWAAVTSDGSPWQGTENSLPEVPLARPLGALAFASELGVLRELPWFRTELNLAALGLYLRFGYIGAPYTIYQAANKFLPAIVGRVSRTHCFSQHYFAPNEPPGGQEQGAGAVRRTIEQAVSRQLVSDVPIGCFLSGGIDSSIIALSMQKALGARQRVRTFTVGFDDARYDETRYATEVAKHLGAEHLNLTVTPDVAADLPKLAAVFGEPFGDSSVIPTHYLAQATRQHVKVALSGDGGDELFGGYDRYRALRLSQALDQIPLASTIASLDLWQRLPGAHPKSKAARFKRLAKAAGIKNGIQRYLSMISLFPTDQWVGLLSKDLQPLAAIGIGGTCSRAEALRPGRDLVRMALALDRVTYLPGDLLAKVDRASMLHALEVRSPFMNPDVVQLASSLSTHQLLGGGPKRMLREAFASELPRWMFRRRKMGFAVPIGDWLRGELRPMLHDHLLAADSFASRHLNRAALDRLISEHQTEVADHSQRLYALLMLELWWRTAR